MRSPHSARRRALRAVALAGALLLAASLTASPARARPEGKRFTVGVGVAGTSVTGDLDGQRVVTDSTTTGLDAYLGKLDNGAGSLLMGGVMLTPTLAAEVLLLSSQHDAKHVNLPGETLSAHVGSLLGTLRYMVPLGQDFELFGRVGMGPVVVGYDDNTQLSPNPARLSSALTGLSLAAGGGVAVFFDPLGLELAVLQQRARLSEITAAQHVVSSFSHAYVNLRTVTLTLTMHFGLQ